MTRQTCFVAQFGQLECIAVAIGFAGFQQHASYIVIERQIDSDGQ